ncbi:MAG: hypothetical protein HGB04_03945 [Chlorobiaceae bacterium]|nr:hypothetical protein [Chlorobiaceae bacterium]
MARRPTKSDTRKKALLAALEKSLGVVSPACQATGINRSTFYEWYDLDAEFKKAVDEMGELALDFTETKLLKRIKDESDTAIIFYLKTKGKRRGYIERQEVTGADGKDLGGSSGTVTIRTREELIAEAREWGFTEQEIFGDNSSSTT